MLTYLYSIILVGSAISLADSFNLDRELQNFDKYSLASKSSNERSSKCKPLFGFFYCLEKNYSSGSIKKVDLISYSLPFVLNREDIKSALYS